MSDKPAWGGSADEHWVRLMAEVCSSGLWLRDGCPADPEDLPISTSLIADIDAWQLWYDEEDRRHEAGTYWEAADDWDMQRFASRGLQIARRLKAELRDWVVVYHDVSALKLHGFGSARHLWEYEIENAEVGSGSTAG